MSDAESSTCLECGKIYKRVNELRRHVKNWHPDKLNVIAPLKVLKGDILYKCTYCDRQFSHKPNLKFHVKKVHNLNVSVSGEVQKSKQKCPMCNYNATFKKDLIKHYESFHDILIQSDTIKFLNHGDFISWKNKVENDTKANFIKERGKKAEVMNYICHRSGFFRSKSKGQRDLKTQGSNKINGYCPAMIKQITQSDGTYLVHFIQTHVGHENTIEHLFLSASERHAVATKLAAQIPFETVLDDVRAEISDSDSLERKHLLTKKDLYNIKASFNLKSTSVRHQNDAISIDDWMNEMKHRQLEQPETQGLSEEEMAIVCDERTEIIFEEIDNHSTSREKTLTERKEEMLRHLCVMVNSIKSEEQWEALEKMVNPIEPTLAAITQQSISNFKLKNAIATPSHSKIQKHRQLFTVQLTKPTKEACNVMAINLLN